ncbi:MAG: helix-turn-helix domain-containing protein [Eubacteriaceae bacterium]|jgi:AbrB family looped-hinge helix DNA binding protein|uniref:Helix-turn-helix domain-containing protein n=1 Tax=Candidatus Pseudoramibacter fermentans TaxID=2594427 RepID=A0A6L5GSX4_9FIRM|nr:helix-turn-helix domain-containing protein [Candidatus Pseudoramibacter fermentans]RRF93141.1 MAG: helix-turn-helix domain-containing protein [Eubacteriaceae bacterium]
MLKDNLVLLRKMHGYSQEALSEKIGISRQAYAKWESGITMPDIEKCRLLADIYGVSIDSLVCNEEPEGLGVSIPPAPKGKNIWGSVTISDRGQIVIPKAAREKFGLTGGQRLIIVSDEIGIALIPAEAFEEGIKHFLESAKKPV